MMAIAPELPKYQCHKVVRAGKIINMATGGDGTMTLVFEGIEGTITVEPAWIKKNQPQIGGYFVVYGDGYTSYSPSHAFEGGYTRFHEGTSDSDTEDSDTE